MAATEKNDENIPLKECTLDGGYNAVEVNMLDNKLSDRSVVNEIIIWKMRVKLYSIIQIIVALMFWIWALINIMKGQVFDAGVISFIFPFFAGIFGYLSTYKIKQQQERLLYVNLHLGLTIFGHFLVTLNYFGGILLAPYYAYYIYCIVFTAIWGISWILFTLFALKWRKIRKQYINYNKLDV